MKNKICIPFLASPIFFFLMVVGYRRPLSDDEAIFIYGAQQLERGDLFLTGLWDHKGPLLYWLNWISIQLPFPNFLGIAFVQGGLITLSLIYLFQDLEKAGLKLYEITGSSLVINIVLMTVILNLNTTEVWSFPFQLICYSTLLRLLINPTTFDSSRRSMLGYGILCGISFASLALIRINNGFGVFVATLLIYIILQYRKNYFLVAAIATSLTLLVAVFAIYNFSGNLSLLFERYFVYNHDYSTGMSFSRRLFGLNYFIFNYIKSPIFVLVVVLVIFLVSSRKRNSQSIMILGLVAGIDFFSQTLSGRGNRQYIPATVASLLVLTILMIYLLKLESKKELVLISLAIFTSYSISNLSLENLEASWHSGYKNQIADAAFVESLDLQNKTIFYYGPSPQSLVRTNVKSVSQFIYLAPTLSAFSRSRSEFISKLTMDVQSKRPDFILRDSNSCLFNIQVCYEGNEQYLSESKSLASLRLWILKNYKITKVNGSLEVWSKLNK